MKKLTKEEALAQIDLAQSRAAAFPKQMWDWSQVNHAIGLGADTLRRLAPPESFYIKGIPDKWDDSGVERVKGLLQGLREAIEHDLLHDVTELAHASLSADILDQAHTLLSSGYKDAAAVLVGSTLEAHLRNLCDKFSVPTTKADGRPEPASKLTADLKKAGSYGNQEDKMVVAWLALRNEAAHGHYDNYHDEQVRLMLAGVRDFILRHPA